MYWYFFIVPENLVPTYSYMKEEVLTISKKELEI